MNIVEWIHHRFVHPHRVRVLVAHLARLLPTGGRVLDVGAGDGLLAQRLAQLRPDLTLQGVDVLVRPHTAIPVEPFDGRNLPFPDRYFAAVLCIDVLHHASDMAGLLAEMARVGQCVVIKDHLCHHPWEHRLLRRMDRVSNDSYGVALPFNYQSRPQWLALFARMGLRVEAWIGRLHLYPAPAGWLLDRNLHFMARLAPASAGPEDPPRGVPDRR